MLWTEAPCNPLSSSPARVPGSARRTTHIDISWTDDGLLTLAGEARDLVTPRHGEAYVAADATVTAYVDGERRLHRIEVTPPLDLDDLLGVPVGRGFRNQLPTLDEGMPLALLLDDLPVAQLISGYAPLRSQTLTGSNPMQLMPPPVADSMSGTCSGWRDSGTMIQSIRAGRGIPLQNSPPAPALEAPDDPLSWHAIAPLGVGMMRRRRRIDVAPGDGDDAVTVIDAMFRDSHGDPDGTEVILHEYALHATAVVDDGTLVLASMEAEPRVLPYKECPLAANSAPILVGRPVDEVRQAVREYLRSTVSCTHLNDLLRALAHIGELAALVPGTPSTAGR